MRKDTSRSRTAFRGTHQEARPSTDAPTLRPLTVSVKTARQITGLCHGTVHALIGRGLIESVKVGRRRLILLASLEQLTKNGLPSFRVALPRQNRADGVGIGDPTE